MRLRAAEVRLSVHGGPPLPRATVARVAALAEADPAREVCGLVIRLPDGAHEVVAVPNAEPGARARDGFRMEPAALLAALRAWEGRGGEVAAVYHSHLDAPPELSARDRAELTLGGRPTFPGAALLVVSLRAGRATEAALHRWDGASFVAGAIALTRGDR